MQKCISFLLLIFVSHIALSAPLEENKSTFLKIQQETVVLLNEINFAHVKGLRECACYLQSRRGVSSKFCSSKDSVIEPQFIHTIINIYGEKLSSNLSCQSVIDAYVFNRLQVQWPAFTLHMSLMGSQMLDTANGKDDEFLSVDGFDQSYTSNQKYLKEGPISSPQHMVQELPWSANIPRVTHLSLSPEEFNLSRGTYLKSVEPICRQYVDEFVKRHWNDSTLMIGMLPKIKLLNDSKVVCDILLGLSSKKNSELEDEIKKRFQPVLARLAAWKQRFQKIHRDEYAKLIQGNPLLVAVDTPAPTLEKIVEILVSIESNARERLLKSQRDLRTGENEISYLNFSHALPYTRVRWKTEGFGEEAFQKFLDETTQELVKENRKEMYLTGTATVAIMMGCAIPWGRLASPALRLLKSSCLAGLGVPLNAYFLYDSIQLYDSGLKDFFSSIEANQALKTSLIRYQGGQVATILSAILLPIGMNLAEAKVAKQLISSLLLHLAEI